MYWTAKSNPHGRGDTGLHLQGEDLYWRSSTGVDIRITADRSINDHTPENMRPVETWLVGGLLDAIGVR